MAATRRVAAENFMVEAEKKEVGKSAVLEKQIDKA